MLGVTLRMPCFLRMFSRRQWRQNETHVAFPSSGMVYAVPPDDFKKPDDSFAVWLVLKALYGSPQAGRRWHNFKAKYLRLFGYRQSTVDPCVFFLSDNSKSFPPAFVRDPTSLPWYENWKARLAKHQFKYKALGDVKPALALFSTQQAKRRKGVIFE
eukprot:g10891.t1